MVTYVTFVARTGISWSFDIGTGLAAVGTVLAALIATMGFLGYSGVVLVPIFPLGAFLLIGFASDDVIFIVSAVRTSKHCFA